MFNYLRTSLLKETSQWVLWWPVAIAFGIFFYLILSEEPPFYFSLFLLVAVILIIALGHYKKIDLYQTSFIFFFQLGVAIVLGFTSIHLKTTLSNTKLYSQWSRNEIKKGIVKKIEKKSGEKTTLILEVKQSSQQESFKVYTKNNYFLSGDHISCPLTIWPIPLPSTVRGYDPQFEGFFSGIVAYGKGSCNLIKRGKPTWITHHRNNINQTIDFFMEGQAKEIAKALIMGDRSGISLKTRNNFSGAGISHILAISGLHVSLLAGFIFILLRRGGLLIPGLVDKIFLKKWAAFLSLPFVYYYGTLAGFAYPIQRAMIMITLLMMGTMIDRVVLSLRSVSLAACAILIIFPESLVSASFQLSFAAVIAIIAFYEKIHKRSFFLQILFTSAVATLATTPFLIFTFGHTTLQSLIGNLVAIPLVTFVIMPSLFFSLIFSVFKKFSFFWFISQKSINLLIYYAAWVNTLPGTNVFFPQPSLWGIICFSLSLLWIIFWKTSWRWGGILPLFISFYGLLYPNHPLVVIPSEGGAILYHDGKTLYSSNTKRNHFFTYQWAKTLGDFKVKGWDEPNQIFGSLCLLSDPWKYKKTTWKRYLKPYYKKIILSNAFLRKYLPSEANAWDKSTLKEMGNIYVWIKPNNQFSIKTSRCLLGNRPWRPWFKAIGHHNRADA